MSSGAPECLTLTVAIATTGPRLARIALPPPAPGIDYLITVQNMQDAPPPDWMSREDVTLVAEAHTGLSANRNAGLARATGQLLLFSDDDIQLAPDGLNHLRRAFAEDVTLALALAWRAGHLPARGARRARYKLSRFNSGRAAVPGIMVNAETIRRAGVTFDTRFGIGGPVPLGEDYIFVTDILRRGLRGVSFPVVTGAHPGPSSGDDWTDDLLIKSRAVVLHRVFGPLSGLVRLLYTWRHRRRFVSRRRALRFAVRGL